MYICLSLWPSFVEFIIIILIILHRERFSHKQALAEDLSIEFDWQ